MNILYKADVKVIHFVKDRSHKTLVCTVIPLKSTVLWDVTPCSPVEVHQCFRALLAAFLWPALQLWRRWQHGSVKRWWTSTGLLGVTSQCRNLKSNNDHIIKWRACFLNGVRLGSLGRITGNRVKLQHMLNVPVVPALYLCAVSLKYILLHIIPNSRGMHIGFLWESQNERGR
jgi:hypothetical protein